MRITKVKLVDATTHEQIWLYDVKNWAGISRNWPGEKWDCSAADVAKHVKQFLDKEKMAYSGAVAAGDRPETAVQLIHLGISLYGKDPAEALDYFQQAQNVAPSGPLAGPAMTWQAMIRQHQKGEAAAAESLYRAALAIEEANTTEAALTMESLAHFLREQGRVSEAVSMEAPAREIRKAHVAQLSPKRLATDQASTAGNGVTAPELLHKIEPGYSLEARLAEVQGTAALSVVIGTDGKAADVQLRQGLGYGLDEQALKAITQWTFKPGMRTGVPVPVSATIEVNFRLEITRKSPK
jgi:TonB family protein